MGILLTMQPIFSLDLYLKLCSTRIQSNSTRLVLRGHEFELFHSNLVMRSSFLRLE